MQNIKYSLSTLIAKSSTTSLKPSEHGHTEQVELETLIPKQSEPLKELQEMAAEEHGASTHSTGLAGDSCCARNALTLVSQPQQP